MTLISFALLASVTAGWENICPDRREYVPAKALWQADFSRTNEFVWSFRDGAEGSVTFSSAGMRIDKTNDEGMIVVKGRPIAVKPGQGVRFMSDNTASDSDVNYSSAFLRYHGRRESLSLDVKAESRNFAMGGQQVQRALPCTAPGMTFRRYSQCFCTDDVVTPVLVVGGAKSSSVWRYWAAEDLADADAAWKKHIKRQPVRINRTGLCMDEKRFDALLAADPVDHTAKIERIDGFSRLVLDGQVVAPNVYKGAQVFKFWLDRGNCNFAGAKLDGSSVRLMDVGSSDFIGDYVNADGTLAPSCMVAEVKRAMRLCPRSLFTVNICTRPPRDFISKHHPEEAATDEKGRPLYGRDFSCVLGYNFDMSAKDLFMWPSFSSTVWRDWVKARVREYVAALKESGLSKRVVGVHFHGFHDAQMTVCYTDHSRPAREEYRRIIAEPDCISTNYGFCMRLAAQRAINEFAREFKKAMGKPVIAIKWCESPFQGKRAASNDMTAFTRCDAIDVVVCQPTYSERFPGYASFSAPPMASLHLHGKMFWNELDLRTWLREGDGPKASFVTNKGICSYEDVPMWRAGYRKYAGEAAAARMGYWFYDMRGGWFDDLEIAADIAAVSAEETELARMKPSPWRPGMAVVIDEAQMLEGENPLLRLRGPEQYIYAEQCRYFQCSGVPYESYLMQDVLENPSLLDGMKLAVFAFLHEVDPKRRALLDRLAAKGVTLVYLSESGMRGGADALMFSPRVKLGNHSHLVVPEPGFDVNVMSALSVRFMRDNGDPDRAALLRCTVEETPGVKVLARYASDSLPAIAERVDAGCRRVYVAEPSGLTPDLINHFARESGAYRAVGRTGLQIDMNGDFMAVHCLRPGRYEINLPFDCVVRNMKSGMCEDVSSGKLHLSLTAGESCRFRLLKK